MKHKIHLFFILLLIPYSLRSEAGKVYLVLGSDTAIWEGMNVRQYHCYYNVALYTNPMRNGYQVMESTFRKQFLDSYGQPVKMTWWMMAGNIFRYATNRNVPLPNIMTMYLMRKYHGAAIEQNGDELSLHYHTFAWTDYDGDGRYFWNQSLTFSECREDFDVTLAQLLLEENIFPVSFRSGWHYMDNDWQQYLDELLPYSMHNDWPNVRTDTSEPLDNTFDWSLAPETWIPYHPSTENYQVPGSSRGWNVRSEHMGSLTQDSMDNIFDQANQGIDQVACIWAHLPESDFLENIGRVNTLAHNAAAKYPDVKFRYCTAIEAMQRWQKTIDHDAPLLTIEDSQTGDDISFIIKTNEPIFQRHPFVAIKDVYEQYFILPCTIIARYKWQTTQSVPRNRLAKAGVAVCDMVGNLATDFIKYLPDDIYVDNNDAGYVEQSDNWSTTSTNSWGIDSRILTLTENDTASVKWMPDIPQSGYYNIFVQVPSINNATEHIIFKIYNNNECVDTTIFTHPLPTMDWIYIGTAFLNAEGESYLKMAANGNEQLGKVLAADVAKFSALVRERDLHVEPNFIDLGEVSQDDTVLINLKMTNRGFKDLTISNFSSTSQTISFLAELPLVISGMRDAILPLQFLPSHIGIVSDTLFITSNDPDQPTYAIGFNANVQSFFVVIDNEDSLHYQEQGIWQYSVAQAYGPTSRFSYLHQGAGANATFKTILSKPGIYEIFEIVPTTVNATNHAAYVLSISNVAVDSVIIDQNQGSGNWISLGRNYLPAGLPIAIKVVDTGKSTAGDVLRADAIKFSLIEQCIDVNNQLSEKQPLQFLLNQNFPNPFNASTTFSYSIQQKSKVQLKIYNSLGQEVVTLVDTHQQPGHYEVNWRAPCLMSGIYLYQLTTANHCQVRKLMIIR